MKHSLSFWEKLILNLGISLTILWKSVALFKNFIVS